MITGPPLAAVGKIAIEIFGPANGTARWGISTWGESVWNVNGWRDVTPQSMTAEMDWGADYPEGVLTSPACGQWTIRTYDPNRVLDPSNGASPYVTALRPGNPVRVTVTEGPAQPVYTVRSGLIDTVHYDQDSKRGILRGTDLLQLIARANLPANQTGVPNTLRARAAELVKRVNLDSKIVVDTGLKEWAINPSFETGALSPWFGQGTLGAGSGVVQYVLDLMNGTGDFEDAALPGWLPPSGSIASIAFAGAPSGARLLRIIGSGTSYPSLTSNYYSVIPGQTYILSATAMRQAGTLNGRVRIDGLKNNTLVTSDVAGMTFTTGAFVSASVAYTVPTDGTITQLRVLCFINAASVGSGDTWLFDAVSLGTSLPPVPDGAYMCKIVAGTATPGYRQTINGIYGGQQYTISVWVLRIGATAPKLQVTQFNSASQVVGTGGTVIAAVNDGVTWEKLTLTITTASDVSYLACVVVLNSATPTAGDLTYFDSFSCYGPSTLLADPPVGAIDTAEGNVLDHIAMAARDAQYAFWLDKDGVMRFRSFGDPIDNGLQLGGLGGIAMETLETDASLAGIYTSTTVYDTAAPTVPIKKTDAAGSSIFGEIALLRERPVPNASVWADNLLLDRSGASIQYTPGLLRIQTMAQLVAILNLEMVEICTVAVDSAVPPVNLPARALGVKLNADPIAGWSAQIVTYVPANDWEAGDTPIPPDIPPPINTQQVVRTYNATKDSRAARTSGGANYGSGTEQQLPVGSWSGWRNRAFIDFSAIPWGDVQQIVKAELTVRTSTQVNIGFGSSPKVICKRITGSWSEGSASSPSGGNALIYPGPAVTDSGSVSKSVTRSESTDVVIDVTAIVKAWAPTAIGGSAQTQRGIAIFSAGEDSTTYTTEFLSRESASGKPVLRVTVKIPA